MVVEPVLIPAPKPILSCKQILAKIFMNINKMDIGDDT
jgi:hypothetical protein